MVLRHSTLPVQNCLLGKPEFERYGVALVKSKMMRKDGDWNCFRCGNVNFKVDTQIQFPKLTNTICRYAMSATSAAWGGWRGPVTSSGAARTIKA
jgi:hypothetical protein